MHTCLLHAAVAEQRFGIPRGLLYAIALTESGRWDGARKQSHAWPWTIRAGADAFVLDHAADAIETVNRLKSQGRSNIDVGCMQINLHYHPDAFENLLSAFDPATNVAYAAGFLVRLRSETGSWRLATQYYHNRDPARGRDYLTKVYGQWRQVQTSMHEAQQALRQNRGDILAASQSLEYGGSFAVQLSLAGTSPTQQQPDSQVTVHRPASGQSSTAASSLVLTQLARTGGTVAAPVARHGPRTQTPGGPSAPSNPIHGVDIVRPGETTSLFQRSR